MTAPPITRTNAPTMSIGKVEGSVSVVDLLRNDVVEIPVVMLSNDVVSVLGGGLDEKVSEEDDVINPVIL